MRKYALIEDYITSVDEEKKTVAVKLILSRDQRALDKINESILSIIKDQPSFLYFKTLLGTEEITAKAKCDNSDVFDKEKGIHIARSKAVIKATQKAVKELQKLSDALLEAQKQLSIQIDDLTKKGSRCDKAFEYLKKELYN